LRASIAGNISSADVTPWTTLKRSKTNRPYRGFDFLDTFTFSAAADSFACTGLSCRERLPRLRRPGHPHPSLLGIVPHERATLMLLSQSSYRASRAFIRPILMPHHGPRAVLHAKRHPAAVSLKFRQESSIMLGILFRAGIRSLDSCTPLGDVEVFC
jgi:hypothetical protein